MNRAERRKAKLPKPEAHPATGERVHDLSSADLQHRLVQDAVTGTATPLAWAVAAYLRIAALDRISADDAYVRVRQEVGSLGGVMPDAPGS